MDRAGNLRGPAHQELGDGRPRRLALALDLGQAPLKQAQIRPEIGERMMLVGVVKLAEGAQVPAQRSTVGTRGEPAYDPQAAGHLSQLPGQVWVATHPVHVERPRLLGPARGQGMRNRLFHQVQRGRIGRQTRPGPLDEPDQLLADQVVPESAFRGRRQLAEVIAHGGVDAHRLVGFAQDQVPPHQGRQHLLQLLRAQRRQRAAGFPFLLEQRTDLANPAEHPMLDRVALEHLLDRAEALHDIRRGQVFAFARRLDPACLEECLFQVGSQLPVGQHRVMAEFDCT